MHDPHKIITVQPSQTRVQQKVYNELGTQQWNGFVKMRAARIATPEMMMMMTMIMLMAQRRHARAPQMAVQFLRLYFVNKVIRNWTMGICVVGMVLCPLLSLSVSPNDFLSGISVSMRLLFVFARPLHY